MRIIIVGCGKVGYTIAKNLSDEKNVDVTIIDNDPDAFDKAAERIDAILVKGNALSARTLNDANINGADLLVCVTDADEVNLLCCITAKHLGAKHTIARVRDPEVTLNINKLWRELGLDMIINPEMETALEISRLLRFPMADDIDVFVNNKVELVSFKVADAAKFFVGKSVAEVFSKRKLGVLCAIVERDDTAIIPHGELVFEDKDTIRILGRIDDVTSFFSMIGKNTQRIKDTVIMGGGRITYYLVNLLQRHGGAPNIKIIEINKDKCEELSEAFPRCMVIHGDGTDEDILQSEALNTDGAILCLSSRDEDNTVVALYSLKHGMRKVVVKINHINPNMIKHLGLGSIVSPKVITSDHIIRYVRGLASAAGSDSIRTVYTIYSDEDTNVEAIEINVTTKSRCLDVQLMDLRLKRGILIGCIVRGRDIIIPTGATEIKMNDSVIIIAKNEDIIELDDILLG